MNRSKRIEKIVAIVEKEKEVKVSLLPERVEASRDTIRRDIIYLAELGVIERTHGYIKLAANYKKLETYNRRLVAATESKLILAKLAKSLLKQQQTIYLDVSTTIATLAEQLTDMPLNVFTNSLDVINELVTKEQIQTYTFGGKLNTQSRYIQTTDISLDMQMVQFDYCLISAPSISEDGIFYAYPDDFYFKKLLRKQSKKLVLLVDDSKFDNNHNFKVFGFEDIDLVIANRSLPSNIMAKLKQHNVKILLP
ncbi:DeoR/GlpR family DNA-binding transcription regulator [Vagococcus intermedius]|uniref:DeoR/GlpR family DNA-binding transcription regulator n=1 Tax=Vagococcus intermedius TaxID=2991418 RepID=A0AAF0CUA1_9ENTE|nr:DeoR/GlpR family DNA-binding transcription regulator [Vagococcus intermedius]WEG73043.1 DeoR/GlpR family DNA-binding transcription regulator [Vagococcus intermedius]WEG75128.1 DeoR/GlpR family DNA-binding transcription regulator [Vagococcus intermedius]